MALAPIDFGDVATQTRPFTPSPQQQAIFDWIEEGTGNAIVVAVAGAGKTSTLIEGMGLMQGRVALAAYNKKIADEISAKLAQRGIAGDAGTFHSFGFRAWRKSFHVKVEGKKLDLILENEQYPKMYWTFARQAVSLAKQAGIGIISEITDTTGWYQLVEHFGLDEMLVDPEDRVAESVRQARIAEGIGFAIRLLNRSIEQATTMIDFDDMIYMPLLRNATFDLYDWVLVDEAQDSNYARRELASRMLAPGGRLIAVGDPHQAIYGFTGADSDALDIIRDNFSAHELPLTVTFRCPKAVVEIAQRYVKHIEAHESSPIGVVDRMDDLDFHDIDAADLQRTDAVLCRNTKPLVKLAFHFIRREIPCHIEGRDIGIGLQKLVNRWPNLRTVTSFLDKLDSWSAGEIEKLEAKKRDAQAGTLQDQVDTLHVIAENLPHGASRYDLIDKINRLFADVEPGKPSPNLTLSTIHKAKGREWPTVYWYQPNLHQPSRYAKQDWQLAQEINLMYVAATRAMSTLVIVRGTKEEGR